MQHLSEVLKLIEHGVAGNQEMARGYALLLADKFAAEGEDAIADQVRRKANGVPPAPEESVSVPEQARVRTLAAESADNRTRAIVEARVDLAMTLPVRLEIQSDGRAMTDVEKRDLLTRGFHEIAKGMGVDRFAETPVSIFSEFVVMSIIKNHDTQGLLRSLVNSFIATYATPETSEAAFKALTDLEGQRATLVNQRKAARAAGPLH